jgi:hypothetical protein
MCKNNFCLREMTKSELGWWLGLWLHGRRTRGYDVSGMRILLMARRRSGVASWRSCSWQWQSALAA